jgi:hypothetical protein
MWLLTSREQFADGSGWIDSHIAYERLEDGLDAGRKCLEKRCQASGDTKEMTESTIKMFSFVRSDGVYYSMGVLLQPLTVVS